MSFLSDRTPVAYTAKHLPAMLYLVVLAFVYLARFDLLLARRNFASLYDSVRQFPLSGTAVPGTAERLCKAIDLAALGYWKRILCLQRSAATTCFLRRFGVPAQMVIGTQQMPFKAHAWVEVDGQVVNDRPYICELYAVLDRC